MSNLIKNYAERFFNEAMKSDINYRLAAGILCNKKLISTPCCNINRNYCRGNVCSSLHAEANALLTHYGKNLQFDTKKNRWYLKLYKYKKYKES